jgi:hypothetical protein
MKLSLVRLFPVLSLFAPASCVSLSSSSSPTLLTEAQGPGVYASETAVVGTRFPVTVRTLSLPGGDCGAGPCPPGSDALTAMSAECDASACTAVVDTASTDVATFLVTPTVAGATVLHVHVRGGSGDYSDTLAMTFVPTSHIEVHEGDAQPRILNRVKYASLPGSKLDWTITLESDDGTRLAAEASRIRATVDGAAFAAVPNSMGDPSYVTLAAMQPGTSAVHLTLGAVTRSVSLSVIDAQEVTRVEFHPVPVATPEQEYGETLEGPDVFSASAATSLTVSLLKGWAPYALVLRTKSGAPAMGGASHLSVVPLDLGTVVAVDDGFLTLQSDATRAGTGSLTGTVGSATVSIPVVLTD